MNNAAWPPAAQAAAYAEVESIQSLLDNLPAFKTGAVAHARFLRYKIRRGLDQRN